MVLVLVSVLVLVLVLVLLLLLLLPGAASTLLRMQRPCRYPNLVI